MRKSHGYRHGTRRLFSKRPREKGIRPPDYLLTSFEAGDIVDIIIDPSEHNGMPHRRFHGKTGVIKKLQGDAFLIEIKQGKAKKQVITTKEHLRKSRSVIQA
ncbi:MAG: 50S ribosomal protein L21e [Candidatus Heimdallarchaeaceae archaeon]